MLPAFTLIELLVATAISSVIMIALAATLAQIFQVSSQTTERLALAGDTTLAVEALARDINSAASAAVVGPRSLTLTQPDPERAATRTVVYTIAPPLLVRSENGEQHIVARRLTEASRFEPTGVVTGSQRIAVRRVGSAGDDSLDVTLELGLRLQPSFGDSRE